MGSWTERDAAVLKRDSIMEITQFLNGRTNQWTPPRSVRKAPRRLSTELIDFFISLGFCFCTTTTAGWGRHSGERFFSLLPVSYVSRHYDPGNHFFFLIFFCSGTSAFLGDVRDGADVGPRHGIDGFPTPRRGQLPSLRESDWLTTNHASNVAHIEQIDHPQIRWATR